MWMSLLLFYTLLLTVLYLTFRKTKLNKILTFYSNAISQNNTINQNNVADQNNTQKTVDDIPGPISIPFIGTKWIFYCKYKMNKLHEVYKEMNKVYGPIVCERTSGNFPVVSLFNREDIEKVLRYPSRYPFRPPTEIVVHYRKSRPDRYSSPGVTHLQGEEWNHLRSQLTTGFGNRRILNAFLPSLNDVCDDFIELIKSKRSEDGLIENFQELLNLMSLETICCLILGRRMGYLSAGFNNQKSLLLAKAVKQIFILQRDAYYGNGLWKYIPTKTYSDFMKTENLIYEIVSEMVDETLTQGEFESETDDIKGIYHSILKTNLDIREKKTAIIDFIQASIELLAHTVAFVLYYLSEDQEHQDKIYREFSTAGHEITHEHLSNGHFTKACIQESFRLCPTAFCLARILEEDHVLSGYHLKAGTFVLCQTATACRDEANFSEANKFMPERWLDVNQNNMSVSIAGPGANLVQPFGIGRRSCPGKKFTEIQLSVVVAKLMQAFNIEYVNPLETMFEFIIAPKAPVRIRFTDRS